MLDNLLIKITSYCDQLSKNDLEGVNDLQLRQKLMPIYTYKYSIGKKYIKIYNGDGVYCFVDFEGNLYKPAGWATPAKGIRGNIEHPLYNRRQFYRD